MYYLEKTKFGSFEAIEVANKKGSSLKLVPGHCATPISLQLHGVELLDGYKTADELVENKWAKSVFLFPFPNRLRDGIMHWEGKKYQFPKKASAGDNAIHGFSRNKPFEIKACELHENEAMLTVVHHYRRGHTYFPFSFDFEITFHLTPNSLTVDMQVLNCGRKTMPFGIGWHPYFTLADRVEAVQMKLPPCSLVEVDSRMLPTGQKKPYRHFEDLRPIGDTQLDTCFMLTSKANDIVLVGERGALRYSQENGEGQYPFFQVFTPGHRQSVALEPMSCNVDAFNNGEGLYKLAPKARAGAKCTIEFTKA